MIQIGLDPDGRPAVATYSQHTGGERRDWKDVETVGGSRTGAPVVYLALGSHANYFTPGEYWVRPFPLRDHASAAGTAVRPTLEPLNGDLGWLDWPGDWGSTGSPTTARPAPRSTRSSGAGPIATTPTLAAPGDARFSARSWSPRRSGRPRRPNG